MPEQPQQLMQCMEVWGGNQAADNGVVMAGLDAWVYSKPYGGSEGGGDVYYVSSCATNRILRLLVADVSGHGEVVRDLGAELRRMMRRYVNHIDQVQFVRAMNQQFAALARSGVFATAVVSTFFAPTSRLTLCNAGHPPPLLYRSSTRQWSYLDSARPSDAEDVNLPLGILDLASYQTFDVPLRVGDLVLCYTDSLVESKGPDGTQLGQAGLLRIVQNLGPPDAHNFIPALLDAVAKEHDGNLSDDDVTVLLFRPNGTGRRRPSLYQQVVALKKLGGSIIHSLAGGGEPIPWPDFRLPNIGGVMFASLGKMWRGKHDSA